MQHKGPGQVLTVDVDVGVVPQGERVHQQRDDLVVALELLTRVSKVEQGNIAAAADLFGEFLGMPVHVRRSATG